jgi:pimeloyl-ACP methyl ester carboxylesterase
LLLGMQLAYGAPDPDAKECVDEPVFGGSVRVYQYNTDAPTAVVLIHGINGHALTDWAEQIPVLAERYHVFTFDLPGFAEASEPTNERYSPTNYARLLEDLIGRYLPKPVHLVGHSLGGAIALRYAHGHPDKVQSLVLADIAGVLHPLAISKHMARSWADDVFGPEFGGSWVESLTGKILEGLEHLPDDGENRFGTSARNSAAKALVDENFSAAVEDVAVPVLLLWGGKDGVAPLRTGRVLDARMRNAHLHVIPDAEHMVMRQAPTEVNLALLAFLAAPPSPHEARVVPAFEPADGEARDGVCDGAEGKVFEGGYRSISLRNCADVVIRNARVGQIVAYESRAEIVLSHIGGAGPVGLDMVGSDIKMTASDITAPTAIRASRSRLDMAGVHLMAQRAAIEATRASKFIFSISRLSSPTGSVALHGFESLSGSRWWPEPLAGNR